SCCSSELSSSSSDGFSGRSYTGLSLRATRGPAQGCSCYIRPSSAVGRPSLHHAHGGGARTRGPVAKLAGGVVTPAVDRSSGREATGVYVPGAHRGEQEPARNCDRAGPLREGPVAELARVVVAPAIRGAPGREA